MGYRTSVALGQRPEVMENSIGMNLVKIPAGEFEMGSNVFDPEKPIHRVRITRAFLMGQTEVTQAQWRKVMDSSPWKGQVYVREGTDVAATYVSWDDAVEFCARLTGAALDRLTHRCHILEAKGESFRLRDARRRQRRASGPS